MAITDKLVTVAENTPKVYEAGKNSVFKQFPESLQGSAEGTICALTDISSIEHTMEVKLSSKNLFDLEAFGNADNWSVSKVGSTAYQYFTLNLLPNTTYTFSRKDKSLPTETTYMVFTSTQGYSYEVANKWVLYTGDETMTNQTVTFTTGADGLYYISMVLSSDADAKQAKLNSLSNFFNKQEAQLEQGSVATEYMSYDMDFSEVKLFKQGKNLINQSSIGEKSEPGGITVKYLFDEDCLVLNGTFGGGDPAQLISPYFVIPLKIGASYTGSIKYISGSITKTDAGNAVFYFGRSDKVGSRSNWFAPALDNFDKSGTKVAESKYCTAFWIYVYGNGTVTFDNYKVRIQFEENTKATEYEPYIEPIEYQAEADGTVKGVISIYPVTTLTTDAGAVINCNYIKDISTPVGQIIDKSITEITIPNNVTTIGGYALFLCQNLNKVTFHDNITSIGDYALANTRISGTVSLPKNLTTIGVYAFRSCIYAEKFIFGDKVQSISNTAFQGCTRCLEYDFSKCKSIPTLGTNVFNGISANAKIIVPADLYDEWISTQNWETYKDYIITPAMD